MSNKIVLQGKPQSLAPRTEHDDKVEAITSYLEKFACIDNRVMTQQLYSIYIEALEDLELRRIRQGLEEYLRTGNRWPWPGDLRAVIEDEV